MKASADKKIEYSCANLSEAIIATEGTCKLKNDNEAWFLVEASKLSLEDEFMKHTLANGATPDFKKELSRVIENGIEDFLIPATYPSFADKKKTTIHFKKGEEPIIGKSYNWWKETLKDSDLALGSKPQYVAFIGILLKRLYQEGYRQCYPWDAVVYHSDILDLEYPYTVDKFKMLAADEEGFWLAAGYWYACLGDLGPTFLGLAHLDLYKEYDAELRDTVPWIVKNKKH